MANQGGNSMIKKIFSITTGKGKALVTLATLAFTLAGLLGAYLMVIVVDLISNLPLYQSGAPLGRVWLLLLAVIIGKAFFRVVADMAKHFAGFDVVYQVRSGILRKLKQFSLGFFTNERLGEVSTIIHKDTEKLEGVVGHFMSIMFSDILIALALGIWLFSKNLWMGLAMISLLPIAVALLFLGQRKGARLQKETGDDLADMVSLFVEYTKGIPLMKAYPDYEGYDDRLKESIERFCKSSRVKSKQTAFSIGQFRLFFELSMAVMLCVGAFMLYQGSLELSVFLYFVVFSGEFYKPFSKIESYWRDYTEVKDSYLRVERLLNTPVVVQPTHAKKSHSFDIAYNHVGFQYEQSNNPDAETFTLHDVSFTTKQGAITALVGPSGSGKTTITNLLLRFWDNQSGNIRIGNTDIRDMDYDELLSHISIVMQNVVLFADTILENIRIGNKHATREQVEQSAKKAQIHEFIMTLPDGYDTVVGENGVGLSGGQKQRISIARAFLKNAPIVILDEMTSNVDPVNEVKIQRAVSELAKGRNVLMIAHHLKTVRSANQILVFNHGEIVEAGSHDNLLSQGGLYAKLWNSQTKADVCQTA
jgi:ATP-binding cassette subfamily B protein